VMIITVWDASPFSTPTVLCTTRFGLDIPSLLGGNLAYVGFTGATGTSGARQDILSSHVGLVEQSSAVDAVYVRGSTWAGPDADPAHLTFGEYLASRNLGDATYGYRVDNLPADTTIPWINADEIVLHYSMPLPDDFSPARAIRVEGQLSDYQVTSVTNVDARTRVLRLDRPLGVQPATAADPTLGDRVQFTLVRESPNLPYQVALNAVQGDADRGAAHRVNAIDLGFVRARLNTTPNDTSTPVAAYTAFADLNGDGRINAIDLGAAKARNNDFLPTPPAPAAVVSSSAPIFAERRVRPAVRTELLEAE